MTAKKKQQILVAGYGTATPLNSKHKRNLHLNSVPLRRHQSRAHPPTFHPRQLHPGYLRIKFSNTVPPRHLPTTRQASFAPNRVKVMFFFNRLNAELNPICYLLALLGAHHFFHVNRIRVKSLTLRLLMSYIYIINSLRVSTVKQVKS